MRNWLNHRKKITVLCVLVLMAGIAGVSTMIPHHSLEGILEQNKNMDESVSDTVASAETKGIERILQILDISTNAAEETESGDTEEKRREFEAAEDLCAEDSIVLEDTNEDTVALLAEKLGATYRITSQGDYAVLYLPEGTAVQDVLEAPDIELFLSQMTPDYYAQVSALDAQGNPLNETRPNYTVNDDLYVQQTYLDYLNISDTWSVTRGSGVPVSNN